MNRKALQKLSYGVYLVTTLSEEKQYGCIVNSIMQITSTPIQIAVSLNHDNATHNAIANSGIFVVAILSTNYILALIGGFGYRSSKDVNKFAEVPVEYVDGLPVPAESMAWMTCRVVQTMDAGSHTIFLGEVMDSAITQENAIPMTYQFYHTVIKGESPKNAPTYVPSEENEN